jgi:hypothetical protein
MQSFVLYTSSAICSSCPAVRNIEDHNEIIISEVQPSLFAASSINYRWNKMYLSKRVLKSNRNYKNIYPAYEDFL